MPRTSIRTFGDTTYKPLEDQTQAVGSITLPNPTLPMDYSLYNSTVANSTPMMIEQPKTVITPTITQPTPTNTPPPVIQPPTTSGQGTVAQIEQPTLTEPPLITAPTPGSAASLTQGMFDGLGYSAEDQAYLDEYEKRQREQSLASFDPNKAYQDAMALQQSRIDAINQLYNDMLTQSRIQNEPTYRARLDQSRLQQGLGGYASSAAGTAQSTRQEQANTQEQAGYEAQINLQRQSALANVFNSIDASVTQAQADFNRLKSESTESYVSALKNRGNVRAELVAKAVDALLTNEIDFTALTPEERKMVTEKLGVSEEAITTEFKRQSAAIEAERAAQEREIAKQDAELDKIRAETYNLSIEEQQAALDRALDERKIDISAYNAETNRINAGKSGGSTAEEKTAEEVAKIFKDYQKDLYAAGETADSITRLQEDIARYGIETVIDDAGVEPETRKVLKTIFY